MGTRPRRQPKGKSSRALATLLASLLAAALIAGCKEQAPPAPTPTLRPTSTPSPYESLEEARFVISLEGAVLGYEEIHLGDSDESLVAFSELTYQEAHDPVERRSAVLSTAWYPQTYELEYSLLGARSTWIAAREDEALSCLSNNLEWYAPVLVREIRPEPRLLLERAPSALPYALLALQYDRMTNAGQPLLLNWLDVTEDLPQSRPISITLASRQGAVIGTTGFDAWNPEGGDTPMFTLWVREASRALYGVDVPQFEPGPWQLHQHPDWPERGNLEIKRVSTIPEPTPEPASSETDRRRSVTIETRDGIALTGELVLPEGEGPFPCLVLHASDGISPRREPEQAWLDLGWAQFRYDKRGLGESEGKFVRDRIEQSAADAHNIALALAEDPAIDAEQLVFVGLGNGGRAGMLLLASEDQPYMGYVLGKCTWPQPLVPDQVNTQIYQVLTPHYGWTAEQTAAYEEASVRLWQDWLFSQEEQVSALGRRLGLEALHEQLALDAVAALSQAQAPTLLLHAENDPWLPVAGIRAAQEAVGGSSSEPLTWTYLSENLEERDRTYGTDTVSAISDWLVQAGR